jgi:Tfp pilus assembly protein PilX
MDTEPSRFAGRRGVAMFVVLGTIIVVTLLGFVGLTLAGKDQSQSGDFADLKSTDQVGMAGLQLAINRLTANPANMVTQLNAFITDSRAHSSSIRSWLT